MSENFVVRNALMTLVSDDLTAYGIANKFVMDNPEKLEVFKRCFTKTSGTSVESRTSNAVDSSEILWEKVYAV